MKDEALKLALEALQINLMLLKKINPYKGQEDLLSDSLDLTDKAIFGIEQALAPPAAAQPAQEPLAWVNQSAIDWLNGNMQGSNEYVQTNLAKRKNNSATVPIFTHPPQRTEQGDKHE